LDELQTSHSFFANCNDKQKKDKAYSELKDHYAHLGQTKLSWIIRKWMSSSSSSKQFDTRTLKSWKKKIKSDYKAAGKELKWDQIFNGELHLAFQDNGVSQCIGQAIDTLNNEVSRLKGLRSYSDKEIAKKIEEVEIILHGAIHSPSVLKPRRNEVTQKIESYNKNKVINATIAQLNWQAQQLKPSEETSQVLKWDKNKKEFI
jgi:hypothetical protein